MADKSSGYVKRNSTERLRIDHIELLDKFQKLERENITLKFRIEELSNFSHINKVSIFEEELNTDKVNSNLDDKFTQLNQEIHSLKSLLNKSEISFQTLKATTKIKCENYEHNLKVNTIYWVVEYVICYKLMDYSL